MKLVKPSVEILYCDPYFLNLIEQAGRTCYKSEEKITKDSYKVFIKNLLKRGHESPIEFGVLVVKLITDRGILAEITRHRLASYAVESSRYVDYNKKGIEFIVPFWYSNIWNNIDKINEGIRTGWDISEIGISCGLTEEEKDFLKGLQTAEKLYSKLVGVYRQKPEQARAVLPHCLKTEIVMGANFREWRHIFRLRMSRKAHLQMQEIMVELYNKLRLTYPEVFDIMFKDINKENIV